MKSNDHKKRTFEDKFARRFWCTHARLNSIRSDKKRCRRQERYYGKSLCKESEDTMQIKWHDAACRISMIYGTHFQSTELGDDDDFIYCPECDDVITSDDFPMLEAAEDMSYCFCPICEQKLDLM